MYDYFEVNKRQVAHVQQRCFEDLKKIFEMKKSKYFHLNSVKDLLNSIYRLLWRLEFFKRDNPNLDEMPIMWEESLLLDAHTTMELAKLTRSPTSTGGIKQYMTPYGLLSFKIVTFTYNPYN